MDDIPKGEFVCVYAGHLLTSQGANDEGTQFGDEYLAELDHIESVERLKYGYESEVDIDIDDVSDDSRVSNSGERPYTIPFFSLFSKKLFALSL